MRKKFFVLFMMCVAGGLIFVLNEITIGTIWAAEYEYDKLGRVTKVTYEDKSSVTYEYDANGNIVSVTRTKEEQGEKPQIPQETTAPGTGDNDSSTEQETNSGTKEEETKPQGEGGQESTETQDGTQNGNVTGNGIKEPAETTSASDAKQNQPDGIGTEKGTIGTNETISGTENITDEKSDAGKIGFWRSVWNGIAGFFVWLWSVIKSFFLWLWSLLKKLFELIFGNK